MLTVAVGWGALCVGGGFSYYPYFNTLLALICCLKAGQWLVVGILFFAAYFKECSTFSLAHQSPEVVEEKSYWAMRKVFSNSSLSSFFFAHNSVLQQTPNMNQQLLSSPLSRQTPYTNQELQFNPEETARFTNRPEALKAASCHRNLTISFVFFF